ncbi:MAG: CPXCG motif-containing cysteine-rich protein [Planctomycetota bacterium]|nr:CPXCG motif-containing cysteine-rich protein [Planctomycetota bacterium]
MTEERDLGPQPIGELLTRHELTAQDLVAASDEQLTHKMVARAVKGRRLTPRVMGKVLRALNTASAQTFELDDLFDYAPRANSRLAEKPPEESATASAPDATYTCPSCGEPIVVPVDVTGGTQEYVEDCPVCCSPVLLRVEFDGDGAARISAQAE